MAISTNGTIITRLAGALYGEYLSNASYAELSTTAPATVAANFLSNDFASKTDKQLATTILTNLGLTSITGLDNWLAAQFTAAGSSSAAKGAKLVSILNDYAGMSADPTYGTYATSFNTKTAASLVLSQTAGNAGGSFDTANVVAVKAQTFTLTTGSDDFTGSSANDTFSAPLADNGASNTILSSDLINGGAGVDTLNTTLTGVTNTLLLNNVTNVEKLNLTVNSPSTGTGANVVNVLGATGYTDIALVSVNASAFSLLNLGAIPTSLSLQQTVAATNTVDFDAAALVGTTDNFALKLPGSNAGAVTISDDGSNALETITIASTGSANSVTTLTTTALGTTSLVVTGDSSLTIASVVDTNATLKTFDASALPSTANLTIGATAMIPNATVTGGAGNDAITVSTVVGIDSVNGGAGNDTFTFAATLTIADTIVGGAGTDTLSTQAAAVSALTSGTAYTNISGVETLTLSDTLGANTVTTSFISSEINRVNLTTVSGANNGTLALSAGTQTVANRILATFGAGQTQTITSAGTATTDQLNLSVSPITESAGDFLGSATSALTTTGFETVAISTGAFTASTATTQNLGALNVGSANAITVTGTNSLGLAAGLIATSLDASGMTGSSVLTMGGAPTTITSITGTARADTLIGDSSSSIDGGAGADTITGGSGNDTILGGDGNDSIVASGGADSVLGGAGNDTITATLTAGNVIAGGDGTDTLILDAVSTAITGAGVSGIEVLSLTTTGLAQDMTLFVDNGNSTITRANITGAITGSFTNAGSATNTVGFTSTGTLTAFTRLVDTSTDALTLIATTGAAVTSATAANENTISVTGATTGAVVTVTTLVGAQMATLNVGTANSSTGNFSIPTVTAGSLATVNINTTGSANIGGTANSSSVNMTASAGTASLVTITGGSGADSITGSGGIDSLTGGSGNDTISAAAGADAVIGGTGADRITLGAGADTYTQAITDSVAPSANTLTAGGILVSETITFANGVDVITDFTAGTGGDIFASDAITVATAPTTLVGAATTALTTATNFFASGTWNSTTAVFTILADGTGADTLILEALAATAASQAITTNTNMVILVGVTSSALVAANFI